jgi:hypothetical protein
MSFLIHTFLRMLDSLHAVLGVSISGFYLSVILLIIISQVSHSMYYYLVSHRHLFFFEILKSINQVLSFGIPQNLFLGMW